MGPIPVSWLSLHPKVVAGAVGSGLMAVVAAWMNANGHGVPTDVETTLTAFVGAVFAWLVPNA